MRALILLLAARAAAWPAAQAWRVVVVSQHVARFAHTQAVLLGLGLPPVWRQTPQSARGGFVRREAARCLPAGEPESTVRHLSFSLAMEDVLGLASLEPDQWWLVFEDDVVLTVPAQQARAGIERALQLGRPEGLAYLGWCIPQGVSHLEDAHGLVFERVVPYCTHAFAVHSSFAGRLRARLAARRATDFHAVDWEFLDAAGDAGGFVGVRPAHQRGPGWGVFEQAKDLFNSTMNIRHT